MNIFEFIVYKRRGKIKLPNGIHEEYFSIFSSGCKQFKSVHVKISSIDAKALQPLPLSLLSDCKDKL